MFFPLNKVVYIVLLVEACLLSVSSIVYLIGIDGLVIKFFISSKIQVTDALTHVFADVHTHMNL